MGNYIRNKMRRWKARNNPKLPTHADVMKLVSSTGTT